MTPREYLYWVEGFRYRRDQDAMMMAHFTASAMSVHTKRPVKARDLYRPGGGRMSKKATEERAKRFRDVVARIGPQAYPVKVKPRKRGR